MIFTTNQKTHNIKINYTYDIYAESVYFNIFNSDVDILICDGCNKTLKAKNRNTLSILFKEIYEND